MKRATAHTCPKPKCCIHAIQLRVVLAGKKPPWTWLVEENCSKSDHVRSALLLQNCGEELLCLCFRHHRTLWGQMFWRNHSPWSVPSTWPIIHETVATLYKSVEEQFLSPAALTQVRFPLEWCVLQKRQTCDEQVKLHCAVRQNISIVLTVPRTTS